MTVGPVPEVTVTDGPTGVRAHLEDLHLQADVLDALADELETALVTLGRAELDATVLALALAPTTGLVLEAATGEFFARAAGADLRLRGLAAALRGSADAYTAADELLAASFGLVLTVASHAAGHAVRIGLLQGGTLELAAGLALTVGGGLVVGRGAREAGVFEVLEGVTGIDADALAQQGADRVLGVLADGATELVRGAGAHSGLTGTLLEHVLPGAVSGFAGVPIAFSLLPLEGGLIPRDSQTLTGLLLLVGGQAGLFGEQPLARPGGYHRPVDVTVSRQDTDVVDPRTGRTTPLRAPGSVSELWEREWEQSAGRDNGTVRIERIEGEDGGVRHIVYIPATTSQSMSAGAETTDNTTNVETAAGFESAQHRIVRTAIEEAGIDPGEEVMLVGYSQGGLVAGSLASDPEFRRRVNVTTVFTVGAPVTDFPPQDGIDMLSVEHAQDLIPDLDGGRNADASNWTTLEVDLDEAAQRAALARRGMTRAEIDRVLAGPTAAHSGVLYDGTIRRLDRTGNPGMRSWQRRNERFFDGRVTQLHSAEGTRR